VERYRYNKQVFEACIARLLADLDKFAQETSSHFDFQKYRVLLSIPQDLPSMFIGELLRTLLSKQFGFQVLFILSRIYIRRKKTKKVKNMQTKF
jgi:hypothetical protein